MSECKFCDFKVEERADDELGDYLEGERVAIGEVEIFLSKLANDHIVSLSVLVDSEWSEKVPFSVGSASGKAIVPTGYEACELFDVGFCPMCGRKL